MRTSEILTNLASEPGDRLSVEAIFANLGERSFSLLIVFLGLPNCIPMPPPIALICALLLFAVALQIVFGRKAPWAPRVLLQRSVAKSDVKRAVDKALPYLLWLEKWTRPRLQWSGTGLGSLLIGLLLIFLSAGLLTAAPFIGQIPWGLAVCLFGLGLVERDGVLVLGALVFGSIGASLSAGFAYAIFVAITSWLH